MKEPRLQEVVIKMIIKTILSTLKFSKGDNRTTPSMLRSTARLQPFCCLLTKAFYYYLWCRSRTTWVQQDEIYFDPYSNLFSFTALQLCESLSQLPSWGQKHGTASQVASRRAKDDAFTAKKIQNKKSE